MGYRVIYFDENKKSYVRRIILSVLMFVGFMIWTMYSWHEGRNLLMEVLFPVTGLETETAFRVMIQDLQAGKDMGEAIAVFIHSVFPENIY